MAIGVYFHNENLSAQKYEEVLKLLEAAGAGSPPGRSYHSAFGDPNQLLVFDVWDSQEAFDAFGEKLIPILAQAGVKVGEPQIAPVHNIIIG